MNWCVGVMGMSKQVVNATEANRDPDAECDGLALARKMANQTFSLATDKVYISSLKARNLDADIFAFNFSTRTLQVKNTPRYFQKSPPQVFDTQHARMLMGHVLMFECLYFWGSVSGTPPFEKSSIKSHRFCVLPSLKNHPSKVISFVYSPPPLKNHCFWWALISGWAFISANTVSTLS